VEPEKDHLQISLTTEMVHVHCLFPLKTTILYHIHITLTCHQLQDGSTNWKQSNAEVHSEIQFLYVKGTILAEIHCQLVGVYGPNIMPQKQVWVW
jgi:hypothetical protein